MTSDAVPAGSDPRRLLSDVRALAHRVRLDQRVTGLALLVLAAVLLVGIPAEWYSAHSDCAGGADPCHLRGLARPLYWLPALLVAYSGIGFYAARVAQARGLGALVRPYVLTGAGLALLSAAAWLAASLYWGRHGVPAHPLPPWAMVLDRLIAPAGTIGVALLVLAWLERHLALLAFSVVYLVVVLVPINFGWGAHWGGDWWLAPQLVIDGLLLAVGGAGFALAQRVRR
jgi:hypothetical protein